LHPAAVGLILLSAVAHVYWNLQVKRSPSPALYTWWLTVIGALLFTPIAVWLAWPISIPTAGWYCVGGTGLLYGAYFLLIAQSYQRDDLSRAYPIARGIAPIATAAWGVLFHREHPSLAGWLGILGISFGVFLLAGFPLRPWGRGGKSTGRKPPAIPLWGIAAAVGTGLCTSGYAAVDKEGVQHIVPELYIVMTFLAGALAQGVALWPGRGWRPFASELRRGGRGLLLASFVSLGGYLLVLRVLVTEPVSYVVPVRSTAILLSVLAGSRLLGESGGALRFGAAVLIVLGITAIAVAG
jgi:drug/metabolite transporter (DMT)-like permease